jgi:hypothetical protein
MAELFIYVNGDVWILTLSIKTDIYEFVAYAHELFRAVRFHETHKYSLTVTLPASSAQKGSIAA